MSAECWYLCVWLPPLWCFLGLELCPHYSDIKHINTLTSEHELHQNLLQSTHRTQHPRSAWRWQSERCWGFPGSASRERVSTPLNKHGSSSTFKRPHSHCQPRENNNSNILQSASGRPWVLCKCSFHRSHSCSWCSARAVYRASMELAAGVTNTHGYCGWSGRQQWNMLFKSSRDIKVRACPLRDLSASRNSSAGCVWIDTTRVNTCRFHTCVLLRP